MSILPLHNCGHCYQKLVYDIHEGQVVRWQCQGCGISEGSVGPLTDEQLSSLIQHLQTPKRRLIICHGSMDPPINDPNWMYAETLDIDPNKRPTYVKNISLPWAISDPLWGQFDEILLKNCNAAALLDNFPEDPIQYADPFNPTDAENEESYRWWQSMRGQVEVTPNKIAWYNLAGLLKDGGKLYFNAVNDGYIYLHPAQEGADIIVAVNNELGEGTGMYFVDEMEDVIIGDDPYGKEFIEITKHFGVPPSP
jgi:hypothetical protein